MPFKFNGKEYDAAIEEERKAYFKEYLKEWRKNNRDKCVGYSINFQQKINTDPVKKAHYNEIHNEWIEANREKVNAKQRERYKTYPNYKAHQSQYIKERYNNDEAFRERMKAHSKASYERKKTTIYFCADRENIGVHLRKR
jgi:monoamine oxidase